MNRFLVVFCTVSFLTSCAPTPARPDYPAYPAAPSAPSAEPTGASAARAVPVYVAPEPTVLPPMRSSGMASLHAPLVGCEAGEFSLQVINRTGWLLEVFLDGVPLTPVESFGVVVYLAPGKRLYTCLPSLGEHSLEANAYRPLGVERIPTFIYSYKPRTFRFGVKLGPEVRQTVSVFSDRMEYSGGW